MCCLDIRYLQFQFRILLHLPEMMESCNLKWTFLCHFMYLKSKIQPLLNFSDFIIEIILLRFCYCHFSYKFYKRIYELSTSIKYNTTDIFLYWYSFKQNIAMNWYKTRMKEFIYYVIWVTPPIAVMLLVCSRAPSVNN